jgi:hypothetical protein
MTVAALLATVMVAVAGAMPVGVAESGLKVTWTVQDCPGAKGEVQVLVCEKCVVSERVMPLIVSGSWPVEETEKVEFMALPIRTGPNVGCDGLIVPAGMLGVTVKVCEFETGGPTVVSGADIVMLAVPAVATSEAGTVARRVLLLT